ncbi:MAG TPA: hypothetical protein VGF55_25780, partial [Gemmataceae bacterium]
MTTDLREPLKYPVDRGVAGKLRQHVLQFHHKLAKVCTGVPGVGVVVLHPAKERTPLDNRHAAKEDGAVNRL